MKRLEIVSARSKPMKFRVGKRQLLIPPDEYKARVTDIKPGSYNGKRKNLEFTFEIVEGEFKDQQLRGFVNANYETYSSFTKLYQWYSKVSGDELDSAEEFDLGPFYNKVLNVRVETKISQKTKNLFSNVTAVLGVHQEI